LIDAIEFLPSFAPPGEEFVDRQVLAAHRGSGVHRDQPGENVVTGRPDRAEHLLVGLPLHELARGDVAEQLGDRAAAESER
jgi:hypothetical protein